MNFEMKFISWMMFFSIGELLFVIWLLVKGSRIKEDGLAPYYIDDILFDDDPKLTQTERDQREDRGGSGIVEQEIRNDTIFVERDIILGLNVPGH